jgi:hypothetical protein
MTSLYQALVLGQHQAPTHLPPPILELQLQQMLVSEQN